MPKSLFEKVWTAHTVKKLANGQTQLLIGTHLIHEVTSPQAFGMLRDLGSGPHAAPHVRDRGPHRPTNELVEPYKDDLAQAMMDELRKNTKEFRITFFDRATGKQGIVHIVGPEQGITQPGTTIACGDSHTSTHGAFGAIAFGIGTSQVRDVLATQTMALGQLKVRRIEVKRQAPRGRLRQGRHSPHHPPARRERRHRFRLRIRRQHLRWLLHGGAHDRVQYVHRGRRARRLRQTLTRPRSPT